LKILENENMTLKEEKKKLEEDLAQRDLLINNLKAEISKCI